MNELERFKVLRAEKEGQLVYHFLSSNLDVLGGQMGQLLEFDLWLKKIIA